MEIVPIPVVDFKESRRFKVALSFPGEHRDLVEKIANGLMAIWGKEQILYDNYHRAEFARPNLDIYLQELYSSDSDIIVVFICDNYQDSTWCGIEWRAIRKLMNQKGTSERVMFIRCGEGTVDGVFGTVDGYIDSNQFQIDEIVSDIIKRHNVEYSQDRMQEKLLADGSAINLSRPVNYTRRKIPHKFTDKAINDKIAELGYSISNYDYLITRLKNDILNADNEALRIKGQIDDVYRRYEYSYLELLTTPLYNKLSDIMTKKNDYDRRLKDLHNEKAKLETEKHNFKTLLRLPPHKRAERRYQNLIAEKNKVVGEMNFAKLAKKFRELEDYKAAEILATECEDLSIPKTSLTKILPEPTPQQDCVGVDSETNKSTNNIKHRALYELYVETQKDVKKMYSDIKLGEFCKRFAEGQLSEKIHKERCHEETSREQIWGLY